MTGANPGRNCEVRRDAGSDAFPQRLAEAIAELIASDGSVPEGGDRRRPATLEQLIAAAIYKELPQ